MTPHLVPQHILTTELDSPIGTLRPFVTDTAVLAICFAEEDPRPYLSGAVHQCAEERSLLLQTVCSQLNEYFAGSRRTFDLPLAPLGTEFQLLAWNALQLIAFGKTRSYAAQAASIDRPTAARAIGAANGQNPIPIVVPCHRVIGANGSLTGFAGGLEAKRWLLQHEQRVAGTTAPDQLGLFSGSL
jgi:methylated-DNA-[protein]-cysteine S-methyltransferase